MLVLVAWAPLVAVAVVDTATRLSVAQAATEKVGQAVPLVPAFPVLAAAEEVVVATWALATTELMPLAERRETVVPVVQAAEAVEEEAADLQPEVLAESAETAVFSSSTRSKQ